MRLLMVRFKALWRQNDRLRCGAKGCMTDLCVSCRKVLEESAANSCRDDATGEVDCRVLWRCCSAALCEPRQLH